MLLFLKQGGGDFEAIVGDKITIYTLYIGRAGTVAD